MWRVIACVLLLLHVVVVTTKDRSEDLKLKVITTATNETDGYKRFMRSVRMFDLDVEVVGMHVAWRGGDVVRFPGGGHKVNMLRPVIDQWKNEENLVVMFVDSYDVVFTMGADDMLQKFKDFDCRLVFSAESFCWPDVSLASKYPRVGLGKRFLCSGGFIGYAREVAAVVSDHIIEDTDDDQLYYTQLYLDPEKRSSLDMRLDHRSHFFQNLNGAKDEVDVRLNSSHVTVINSIYDTTPAVLHGNGPSKVFLNYLTNYVPGIWSEADGCTACDETYFPLPDGSGVWPTVLVAMMIPGPSPFLLEVLEGVSGLDYPHSRMSLFLHNQAQHHEALVSAWFDVVAKGYANSSYLSSAVGVSTADGKRKALETCLNMSCDFIFLLDSLAMLGSPLTLQQLISVGRDVTAPLLVRPEKMFSNFWGDLASDGFYARSRDYTTIINYERRGVWNVPFISQAVLMAGSWLRRTAHDLPSWASDVFDTNMAFAAWMRQRGIFMYVSNLHDYGHLLNADTYDTTRLHGDMYQMFDNKLDWEKKYIHPNWSQVLQDNFTLEQPCPDVYWYPLISEAFADELVEEMEHYGQWSGGTNYDSRIAGGFENVPTRDIHMNQVGFEKQWLEVIQRYVLPVQQKVFPGYHSKGHAIMNFVVKYHPQGQASLRPHHDSSTFTINVALSRPGIDHEGGGCRFVRYNCSVTQTKIGWTFMHPGRLTHWHEGLAVTKGTRYIMVSFIDP